MARGRRAADENHAADRAHTSGIFGESRNCFPNMVMDMSSFNISAKRGIVKVLYW